MCCKGKEIELKDLRTPEQQQMMQAMFPLLLSGIQRGATPFGGQLSTPPDPSMLHAMNVMMQAGGQGPYSFPGFQQGPYGQMGGMQPGPFNNGPPQKYPWPHDDDPYGNPVDPYAPSPLPDPYAPIRTPPPPQDPHKVIKP